MNEIKCPKCGEVFQVDEAGYAAIVKQVRDEEFTKELESRERQFNSEKETAVRLAQTEAEKKYDKELNKKDAEIEKLKSDIKTEQIEKENMLNQTEAKKDKEIAELKSKLDLAQKDKSLAISEVTDKFKDELAKKDKLITELNGEKEITEKKYQLEEQTLKEKYEIQLSAKDDEIAFYKDFKAKQSTKMIGESLEKYCENEFNKLRSTGFKSAYFEKDNDVKTGSKGDYIFRDYDSEGAEYISIMFEMKNEADDTEKKKTNEVFFKELDKDRHEKKCEYAVLVSMLEPENDYYNAGIVDVSHKYEKMYVIRPQFFIPIITLLRNAAANSLDYIKELAYIKAQNIDISNFENDLNEFKDRFTKNCKDAGAKFQTAIKEIDESIKHMEKIKEALLLTVKHFNSANNKVEDLSIKKLTKHNPTMKKKFEELSLIEK